MSARSVHRLLDSLSDHHHLCARHLVYGSFPRSPQMSDAEDDREQLQALSLSQLFARALSAASDANDLPTNSDVTQVRASSDTHSSYHRS
jgi:hypothetical protein